MALPSEREKKMSALAERINRKGLREQVADVLRNAIFEGTFKPGELLKDSALATEFNISRSPVRDALLQLEKEFLVRNFHNRGWYVIELTREEISEIVSLRVVLEALALKLAAHNFSDKDLKELSRIQERLIEALWAEDWRNTISEVVKKDFEFHHYIWKLTNHQLLEDTLVRTTRPYFAYMHAIIKATVSSDDRFREQNEGSYRNHQLLIDYLVKPGELNAELCICQHLLMPSKVLGWDRLVRQLPTEIVGDVSRFEGTPSENPFNETSPVLKESR